MSQEIAALQPTLLFKHFDALTKIPRPSKREEKVIAWLKKTIRDLGYEPITDAVGNIVVRKPGSKGHESAPRLLLQSHVDMVCEKNKDTLFDFENDPLQTYLDGDWIRARGTTLGADNGIGVAVSLALLEAKDIVHPPLEMLFTIDEETGLTGASALKPDQIEARRMINLDSEEEGIVYVGCAGGGDTVGRLALKFEAIDAAGFEAATLFVSGLKGGHSGTDIDKGRGNAIKILGQALRALLGAVPGLRVAAISGGSKRNAIAREAEATILLPTGEIETALATLQNLQSQIVQALAPVEPGLKIELTPNDQAPRRVIDAAQIRHILDVILALPHGVLRMSSDIDGLVETSTNLATLVMEGDTLAIGTSQRSLIDSVKAEAIAQIQATLRLGGFEVKSGAGYPGWKPNMNSPLLAEFKNAYTALEGKAPQALAIHAGLECGLIGETFQGMDMISIGPTILDPHSPDERLNVPDTRKFWDVLVELLKRLA
ncbi:MAG: aminoacyl-histidine dipeptidase [Myxococcales bacterium]|jgi:dipeptidase D|nr:aminoacyl-histidine dipeptidase [Myxococcales bacterium]